VEHCRYDRKRRCWHSHRQTLIQTATPTETETDRIGQREEYIQTNKDEITLTNAVHRQAVAFARPASVAERNEGEVT